MCFSVVSINIIIKMNEETLHEVTSYHININKNEEGTSAWHNATLALRSEKGLHFYELDHNPESLEKGIVCLQSYLPCVKTRATAKLFTDKVINSSMRNIDFTTMIQDHSMWPHNPQLMEEMTCIVSFEWSPLGLMPNNESVLAILNNVGGVDLYIRINSEWKHILEVIEKYAEDFMISNIRKFSKLRNTAHMLSSSAMCWCPSLTDTKDCYMATAQQNYSLIIWSVSCKDDTNVIVKIKARDNIPEGEIITMKWVRVSDSKFLLVCANVLGQIYILVYHIQNNLIQLKETKLIWPDKDRMISKHMQLVMRNDKMILICNKHRLLVALMIDENLEVCGQYENNVNDYRLTCITKSEDEIYFATVNCKIFKINIAIKDDSLDVSLCPIEIKDISPTCELYNISFSANRVFCTLITVDRKVNFRKVALKINVTFTTSKKTLDSLVKILVENPTKTLTNHWDVLELLRYKCMKYKEPPQIDYNELYNNACQSIYLLKLYLIFVTFYYNLKRLFKINPNNDIPEDSLDIIKEEILVNHAESLLSKYKTKRSERGPLEGLEKESLWGAINFLEYYCKKNSKNVYDLLDLDKASLGEMEIEYICQGCDEKIQGFSCKHGHLNMFCTLTFTPIEGDHYLSCVWCKRTARLELYSQNPICLFCDVNLKVQE